MAFAPAVWFAAQHELIENGDEDPPTYFDNFDDDAWFETFHLTRPCIDFIVDIVRLHIKSNKQTIKAGQSVKGMVLNTLNYYAQGVLSVAMQEKLGVHQLDYPDVICTISKVLADMTDQFISFPLSGDDRANVANKMEIFCGIPKVLGVLACAHFKIRACPYQKDSFRSFLNTLGYTSVMTQIICDCDGNIMSIEKCCVGSTPEQEVWESSTKGKEMEEGIHGKYYLIGGRGYHLSKHVLTAVSLPVKQQEICFNQAHGNIHAVMQKTICSLKRRFKCLMQLGFAQEQSLDKRTEIINACCVLHNIAKKFSVPPSPVTGKIEPLQPGKQFQMPVGQISAEALEARQELIDANFPATPGDQILVNKNNALEYMGRE
ncbi:putative nuclease HARBI1 [Polymixia lowei]